MLTLGLANGTDRYADKTWPIDGWAGTATPGGAASGEHTTWGPGLQAPEPRGRLQIKVGTPA
ncbi:hypothetical protein [Janibacter sp. GXQ6167]|uniref:hypothetical protein n=1 Tax=Janibacter sp. GXQ6167 TaxID=3240791 RepID=UPI003525584D